MREYFNGDISGGTFSVRHEPNVQICRSFQRYQCVGYFEGYRHGAHVFGMNLIDIFDVDCAAATTAQSGIFS